MMAIAVTDAAMREEYLGNIMVSGEARWIGPRERGQALLIAVTADDPEFFDVRLNDLENNNVELVIQVDAENIASLRSTMDDLLACLSAVESSLDVIQN